jgi:hypothetical protein
MRTYMLVAATISVFLWSDQVAAQDEAVEEIVVTGARMNAQQPRPSLPAVAIRKRADFLLQAVELTNDTRDERGRKEELHQTIRGLAQTASRLAGVSLAYQQGFLIPITAQDFRIPLAEGDDRDDTNTATIFIKYALTSTSDVNSAIRALDSFAHDAKMVGRMSLEPTGEVALSVVNPERYRGEIIAALAQTVKDLRGALTLESC